MVITKRRTGNSSKCVCVFRPPRSFIRHKSDTAGLSVKNRYFPAAGPCKNPNIASFHSQRTGPKNGIERRCNFFPRPRRRIDASRALLSEKYRHAYVFTKEFSGKRANVPRSHNPGRACIIKRKRSQKKFSQIEAPAKSP